MINKQRIWILFQTLNIDGVLHSMIFDNWIENLKELRIKAFTNIAKQSGSGWRCWRKHQSTQILLRHKRSLKYQPKTRSCKYKGARFTASPRRKTQLQNAWNLIFHLVDSAIACVPDACVRKCMYLRRNAIACVPSGCLIKVYIL